MPKGYRKDGIPLGAKIGNKIRCGKKMPDSVKKIISIKTHGKNNPRWKGGEILDKDGYVLVKKYTHPHRDKYKNYVRKHRLVMESHIGRILLKTEVVHHINGIKNDNRIENLHLFNSNSEHTIHHLRERYARKIKKTRISSSK